MQYLLKAVLLLSALCFGSVSWAQSLQKIEGTSISIVAPDGYTPASSFSGLENLETSSSIMIVELPVSGYEEMAEIFGDEKQATEQLATRGVTVTEVSKIELGGKLSPFVQGHQRAAGQSLDKYIVFSKHDKAIMVSFNIFGDLTKTEVEVAIKSISVSSAPTAIEKLAALPFKVEPKPPFIHTDIFSGAAMLKSFEDIDPTGLKPLIIIAPSIISIDMSNLEAAAENAIRQTANFRTAKIKSHSDIIIDGKKSIKSVVTQDGVLMFHYVYPNASSGYLRLIAKGKKSDMKKLETVVDEIAQSMAMK